MRTDTTDAPASAVFDKGRRGNPLPGCDCVQCFGYCMIDGDEQMRNLLGAQKDFYTRTAAADDAGLGLSEHVPSKFTGAPL